MLSIVNLFSYYTKNIVNQPENTRMLEFGLVVALLVRKESTHGFFD